MEKNSEPMAEEEAHKPGIPRKAGVGCLGIDL